MWYHKMIDCRETVRSSWQCAISACEISDASGTLHHIIRTIELLYEQPTSRSDCIHYFRSLLYLVKEVGQKLDLTKDADSELLWTYYDRIWDISEKYNGAYSWSMWVPFLKNILVLKLEELCLPTADDHEQALRQRQEELLSTLYAFMDPVKVLMEITTGGPISTWQQTYKESFNMNEITIVLTKALPVLFDASIRRKLHAEIIKIDTEIKNMIHDYTILFIEDCMASQEIINAFHHYSKDNTISRKIVTLLAERTLHSVDRTNPAHTELIKECLKYTATTLSAEELRDLLHILSHNGTPASELAHYVEQVKDHMHPSKEFMNFSFRFSEYFTLQEKIDLYKELLDTDAMTARSTARAVLEHLPSLFDHAPVTEKMIIAEFFTSSIATHITKKMRQKNKELGEAYRSLLAKVQNIQRSYKDFTEPGHYAILQDLEYLSNKPLSVIHERAARLHNGVISSVVLTQDALEDVDHYKIYRSIGPESDTLAFKQLPSAFVRNDTFFPFYYRLGYEEGHVRELLIYPLCNDRPLIQEGHSTHIEMLNPSPSPLYKVSFKNWSEPQANKKITADPLTFDNAYAHQQLSSPITAQDHAKKQAASMIDMPQEKVHSGLLLNSPHWDGRQQIGNLDQIMVLMIMNNHFSTTDSYCGIYQVDRHGHPIQIDLYTLRKGAVTSTYDPDLNDFLYSVSTTHNDWLINPKEPTAIITCDQWGMPSSIYLPLLQRYQSLNISDADHTLEDTPSINSIQELMAAFDRDPASFLTIPTDAIDKDVLASGIAFPRITDVTRKFFQHTVSLDHLIREIEYVIDLIVLTPSSWFINHYQLDHVEESALEKGSQDLSFEEAKALLLFDLIHWLYSRSHTMPVNPLYTHAVWLIAEKFKELISTELDQHPALDDFNSTTDMIFVTTFFNILYEKNLHQHYPFFDDLPLFFYGHRYRFQSPFDVFLQNPVLRSKIYNHFPGYAAYSTEGLGIFADHSGSSIIDDQAVSNMLHGPIVSMIEKDFTNVCQRPIINSNPYPQEVVKFLHDHQRYYPLNMILFLLNSCLLRLLIDPIESTASALHADVQVIDGTYHLIRNGVGTPAREIYQRIFQALDRLYHLLNIRDEIHDHLRRILIDLHNNEFPNDRSLQAINALYGNSLEILPENGYHTPSSYIAIVIKHAVVSMIQNKDRSIELLSSVLNTVPHAHTHRKRRKKKR